jgi:hypothetical protein
MTPIDYFMAIFTGMCIGLAGVAVCFRLVDPMMISLTGALAFGLILLIGSVFFWRRV